MPLPAIVLAGGLGTRLRSVVADRPKVLAPVAGAPFLAHLLRHLGAEGISEVVLATGHLGEQVAEFVEGGVPGGMRVRCVQEEQPLGTGGAVAFAARSAGLRGPVLALNGDTFFGGRLGALAAAHPEAAVTMALAHVDDASRYGRVVLDRDRVAAFEEKREGAGPALINAGVYVLSPGVLDGIEAGAFVSLERDVFPGLVGAGQIRAVAFPEAAFLDIGTPDDFARAEAVLRRL
ncbi:MAG: sugar phosphate nucleotidyltransferase [Bacteroidota bacterium]